MHSIDIFCQCKIYTTFIGIKKEVLNILTHFGFKLFKVCLSIIKIFKAERKKKLMYITIVDKNGSLCETLCIEYMSRLECELRRYHDSVLRKWALESFVRGRRC